jgi:hypothetical protein
VSGTALILKGLVDSGQLGGILTEAAGLLRDIATKDKGYEPMNLDQSDISSTMPPNYRQQIPQKVRKQREPEPEPEPEPEYEYEEDVPPPPTRRKVAQAPVPQAPQSLPPSNIDFPAYSAEWFAGKITEKYPGTEWDVALKASQLILQRAQLMKSNLNDPNVIKEMAFGMLAIIAGAQGVITLAKSAKEFLAFDEKGVAHRTPEEAAEFIKKEMPEKLNIIKNFDWDMMMDTSKHFENCKSTAKPIMFLKHPTISPIVRRFLSLIKSSPPIQPPNLGSPGSEDGFEENPFGGF